MIHKTETDRRAVLVADFCDSLIDAGAKPGVSHALRWPPFVQRAAVKETLALRGYELCEEGANHDPRLRRFFAAPTRSS